MSCGCGGMPPSVTLRLQAAQIAAGSLRGDHAAPHDFKAMADAVHAFIIADLPEGTLAEMDDKAKTSGNAINERNAFLNGPLAVMRTLREATIDKLERIVMQPGALVQAPREELAAMAGLSKHELTLLDAELEARGLRYGMDADELRAWIKGGGHGHSA